MFRFLLILVALHCAQAAITMQMSKVESRGLMFLKEGNAQEWRNYYKNERPNRRRVLAEARSNRASRLAAKPLSDYGDVAYTVNVTFGTPPQQAALYVDIYNGDTWVVASNCKSDFCVCQQRNNQNCYEKHTFDAGSSSTFVKDGRLVSERDFRGTYGKDTVGLDTDLQIPGVTFGMVVDGGYPIGDDPIDGVLGLTFQTMDGVKSVIQEAYDQQLIKSATVSFYYGTYDSVAKQDIGGQITYGDVDTIHCALGYDDTRVLSTDDWSFNIDTTQVNNNTVRSPEDTWVGMADHSIEFIIVPEYVLDDIVDATQAQYNEYYYLYQVSCDVQFQWSFTLGGDVYTIDQSHAVIDIGRRQCFLQFESSGDEREFVLGAPFLRAHCMAHNLNGLISFSPVIQN